MPDKTTIVCGGNDNQKTLATCELYDQRLGNWIIVSSMTEARSYHRATLLPNGTILITGGVQGDINSSQALNTAEIYYPDIKTSIKTGNMLYRRASHTQTLLPDGNVLLTGGISIGNYSNTAELFITTANTFVPLPSIGTPRAKHTATLLKDGNVLICGGYNGNSSGNVLNSCIRYNSSTNDFTTTGVPSLNYMRHSHTAHLLEDGRVIILGGNNGSDVVYKAEVFDGSSWQVLGNGTSEIDTSKVSNHSSLLLPNNDILITGGERVGLINGQPSLILNYGLILPTEFYDIKPEFEFGDVSKRVRHTTSLLPDNNILVVGGWNGADYLDTVKKLYYLGTSNDQYGLETLTPRKPIISTTTLRFDRNEFVTIVSTYSNLHGISEISSVSGGRNSDTAKPQIFLRSIDSDFTINLSSQIYLSTYTITSISNNWAITTSTITIKTPSTKESLPYGWYYLYVCNGGVCSDNYIVQASTPRPSCDITNLAATESESTTSIKWNWSLNTADNANGFAVFSASDVFITTVPFPSPLSAPATYYQTGLLPNTPSAIKVGCYNIGGFSDPNTYAVAQSTVYTKANPPKNLSVTYASFDTVDLAWDGSNNNPDYTAYQVEISTYSDFSEYATMMSFVNNYKLTTLTIRNLEPNWRYYFRVKARNGNGVETVYDIQNPLSSTFTNPVSTITVGNIIALDGTPLSPTSIKWSWNRSWNKSGGATGYEIYEYKVSTNFDTKELEDVSVFLSSTPYNYYTQVNLSTNTSYVVKVRSYKQDAATYNQLIYGPFSISGGVYTLAAVPAPSNNVFTQVTTGSFKVNWDANGNTDVTRYRLDISQDPNFASYKSYEVKTDSTTFPYIYEYVSELKPNYKYYARVYALNEADKITDTAANLGYKYTLAQPVGRVYVTSVTLSGVTVNWDPKENSPDTIYQVRATSVSFESPYVSTPVPFGKEYKGTSYVVNGLWINTTYYFDVSARNVEGQPTAEIQTTTPAVTLAGPAGAPPPSIVGVTDPNADTEITGILIDNRPVVLYVPKESFNTPQPLAVAKLNSNPCGYTFGGSTITFGIYANAEPYVPVKFTFDYFSDEAINPTKPPDINTNKSKIALARYNPDTGQCLPVKTVVDSGLRKITADLNHFSLYQLIILSPASDLNNIKVFPNPFYPNRPGQGMITITNLPEKSKIKIYTISGQKVFETESDSTGTAYWEGLNSKGQMVGSGVYLCHIKSNIGSKTIKIAVER
ncbi:MAG TPA: fibronectin type III domain-containing protein [Elusimicrobiales bacterium]|nr:fibronectin type III domain-containing protein [Elusimicrobiales bacterium]